METAQDLVKLNGIRFAGDSLSLQIKAHPVKFGPSGGPKHDASSSQLNGGSAAIKDRLMELLQTRVDMQSSSLDLSSLATDPIITSMGADPLRDGKIFKAILVVAAQLYPNIVTMNLASNGLHSLKPIAELGYSFPNIRNLSLMNNMISDYRELNYLSSLGSTAPLKQLSELILIGNPLREAELAAAPDGANYIDQVQQRFPTVSMLDMNPIAPRTQPGKPNASASDNTPAATAAKKLPFPTKPSFVENREIEELSNGFLAGFFGLYDSNRAMLAGVYDPVAQFSLLVDTTHPTSSFAQNNASSQKHVDFSTYLNVSRNLSRMKSHQKRISTLILGSRAIIQALMLLPPTQHPIQDAQRFSFESWQSEISTNGSPPQPAIIVVVHGEFTEAQSQNTISFDRTFVLVPAQPGSPAASAGWPCAVRHDNLIVRRYNGYQSWQPEAAGAGAQTPAGADFAGLTPEQQAMAQALQAQTGMNSEWTVKCLADCGWNFQQAAETFERVRSTLPPQAFQ
ncbi:nuclear mRNA export, poly(A)+RNA binding protein [Dipsacomyces acuminosporus]|nr:nuclear mRNA export, poly(A)+RNA binding protein [Dipsacomyces acuminosporus]